MTPPHRTEPPEAVLPELEEELSNFRREWIEESKRRKAAPQAPTPRSPPRPPTAELTQASKDSSPPAASLSSPTRRKTARKDSAGIEERLEGMVLEEKWKPKAPQTALELYAVAVASEREGRLNDALSSYRQAFRLDPDVDKAYHRAVVAPHASRGSEPHGHLPSASTSTSADLKPKPTLLDKEPTDPHAFQFQRTLQMHPDYTADSEHRSVQAVEEGMGAGTAHEDTTHPSSTTFLFQSLMRSIAANPYERPAHAIDVSSSSTSPPVEPSPLEAKAEAAPSSTTSEQALADLTFIPEDPELPLPLLVLPREVLLLILRFLALTSVIPPPRPSHTFEAAPTFKSKRGPRKKTLKEEMNAIELDLELEDVDRPWKMDVEALERFARTCRAGRILTLDSGIWRALCRQIYIAPHQISREEDALHIVKSHGNDWRRCFIEHPRLRFDGCYISVVTYLRRGEGASWYAPSHLITFYRYFRFYASGLAISLLSTDAPGSVVRGLNPSLRVKGLTFGRWRLRGDEVDLWGLEDPSVEESRRKYSFRVNCRLKSSTRGRMNKLEMLSMATEHRTTLELEGLPIKPTKPFFFSKVASYAGEDLD